MNDLQLFAESELREKENTTSATCDLSARCKGIERSALWAAYGDALGWISELTDRAGLKRRTGGAPLNKPVAWKRMIGGRTGVNASLPRGCYSDDSQLRLASSRAIRADGFDVEAFAKVELPVWLSYGLGGGKSTSAAAARLGRKTSTWWRNRFKGWTSSGGNGAAMRVQPHVWAAKSLTDAEGFLPDVVRNTICTHSHPTGLLGAVLHALCVAHAMSSRCRPSPDDLHSAIQIAKRLPIIIDGDAELRYWRLAFEQEAGDFGEAWTTATDEAKRVVEIIDACNTDASAEVRYEFVVKKLKLRSPDRRGSGVLTALAAAGLAWQEARPAEAIRIAANAIGTDTDTIATMTGAILGAASDVPPPVDVLDANLFRSEAHRLARVANGEKPPSHPYPDLDVWSAPKSRADALAQSSDGRLVVCGLGFAAALDADLLSAQNQFGWQWIKLEFGQTLLIKRREHLPIVEETQLPPSRSISKIGKGQHSPIQGPQPKHVSPLTSRTKSSSSLRESTTRKNTHDIREVVSYMAKNINDDRAVGRTLRRVVRKGTTGEVAGFTVALVEMLRNSHTKSNNSGDDDAHG